MYSVSNRDGRPCWSNILSFFVIVFFSFYGFRLFGRLLSRRISFPSEGEWLDVWLFVIKFLPFYIFLHPLFVYMNSRFLDIFLKGLRNGMLPHTQFVRLFPSTVLPLIEYQRGVCSSFYFKLGTWRLSSYSCYYPASGSMTYWWSHVSKLSFWLIIEILEFQEKDIIGKMRKWAEENTLAIWLSFLTVATPHTNTLISQAQTRTLYWNCER